MVKPAKRPKAILCPNCAVPMRVYKTVGRADQSIQRVRQCRCCGHRTVTYERPRQPPAG